MGLNLAVLRLQWWCLLSICGLFNNIYLTNLWSSRLDLEGLLSLLVEDAVFGSQRGSEEKMDVRRPMWRLLLVSSRWSLTASFPVIWDRDTDDRRRRFFKYCSKFYNHRENKGNRINVTVVKYTDCNVSVFDRIYKSVALNLYCLH
jgi:hypothetical protein